MKIRDMKARMSWRFTLIMALISSASGQALAPQNLRENPPESVLRLLAWPTGQIQNAKGLSPASTNAARAVLDANRWLRRLVDSQWMPEKPEPICIAGEFDNRDVVRYRWTRRNRSFMVAQTGSVFVMQIVPEPNGLRGESKGQHLELVRRICEETFTKSGQRPDFQGGDIEVPAFNSLLLEFSFSGETTLLITNNAGLARLAGRPRTMEEEGVIHPSTAADAQAESEQWLKPGWERTSLAWSFWFRNLHWFADQERVSIYFLKAEAGPHPLLFTGSFDDRWFSK